MINILERQFDPPAGEASRLANGFGRLTIKTIKERAGSLFKRFGAYLKRLLLPLYLFPIKLITYTAYYLVKFLIKFIFAFIGLIFDLLSEEYLKKTNFEEWTNRFTDILDVDVIKSEKFEDTKDTAFVKFSTKNWVDGEAEMHFYEGTWQTVKEDGVYKMLKSKIIEVENPGWDWFYSS